MESRHSKTLGLDEGNTTPQFQGVLKKWTNYVLGWKDRFFVLKEGILLYYKSQDDVQFGCRGAVNLATACIKAHDIDEYRFDIQVCDLMWYLRSESKDERQNWMDVLKMYAVQSSSDRELDMCCRFSLDDKIRDLGTYRDLLTEQLEALKGYFDTQSISVNERKSEVEKDFDAASLSEDVALQGRSVYEDLKIDIMAFKATIAAFLITMSECSEIIKQKEQQWITKELDYSAALASTDNRYDGVSPEMVEGRHCSLKDGEFYDAVEYGIEKIEEEAALRKRLENLTLGDPISFETVSRHPLWKDIEKVTEEQVQIISSDANENSWLLLVKDGDMELFTRELEIDGIVNDPLKACWTMKGVTGREVCHYFFNPQYRKDWETTLEQMVVVERIGENTMIFHQIYKRIWPTAQRDLLFWSHLVHKKNPKTMDGPDVWAVVNKSVDLPEFPGNSGKYIRMVLSLCLYCVTEISRPTRGDKISRDDITCRLTYCSTVNPGGWVPATAVRALRRKEYPKFLNKFTSYVLEQTRDKEIMF